MNKEINGYLHCGQSAPLCRPSVPGSGLPLPLLGRPAAGGLKQLMLLALTPQHPRRVPCGGWLPGFVGGVVGSKPNSRWRSVIGNAAEVLGDGVAQGVYAPHPVALLALLLCKPAPLSLHLL